MSPIDRRRFLQVAGVTAGAALAATIVLAVLPGTAPLLPAIAFIGALLAAIVVYIVSWRPGFGSSPMRMILAGVAVNAVLGAVIGRVRHAHRVSFDRDATLALQVHVVEDLILHLLGTESARPLQHAIGKG